MLPNSPTRERQLMRLTGESLSPAETCSRQVPERYCVVARRGGKLREGNCSAQTRTPMPLNSTRPPRLASLRRRRRLRVQAKGLFHTSPGHSPWVRGPVFPSQAKGLLHRFEAVALEGEAG